jgi:dTDP-4-dehydrorhamnose reductase
MKLLVTGGAGQLASALAAAALPPGVELVRVGRPQFDFDFSHTIEKVVSSIQPTLVVNAAAYTAVDAAETDEAAACRANRDGPQRLAGLCARHQIDLIHVSTDYVFDGSKGAPYVETDPTSPTGVYGASKLAGEALVLAALPQAVVLRTAWVYSHTGKNFVKTMLNLARKTDHLRVVADQIGCPTNAADLAAAILAIAVQMVSSKRAGGIYHAAGTGWTSWHGLACAAFEAATPYGLKPPSVAAITTADYPTPARRPADSRLDCMKLAQTYGVRLPPWRESLGPTVAALCDAPG